MRDTSPLMPGYRLDRYELLCPIAEGGMASVWIARMQGKHGFEKLVAIKTILPHFAADPDFQRMFLDEARIAARIEHVNVAHILDLGDERGVLYLVMEWVDGDALSRLQRAVRKAGTVVPLGVALRILADASSGLHAAHELRDDDGSPLEVVHRDVSPQNILVNANGIAKVIDFGIAIARDRVGGQTSNGTLKGKVQYMAPEQALGRNVDRRADVWAIGAVLYHLVTGRPPFEGPNQLATLHLLTSGRPPVPLPADVPKPVQNVLRKALHFAPDQRYATAAELSRALETAMVEASLSTTVSDVAAFCAKHLSERVDTRKRAIALASDAASERARVGRLLAPPEVSSYDALSSAEAVRARGLAATAPAADPDMMATNAAPVKSRHRSENSASWAGQANGAPRSTGTGSGVGVGAAGLRGPPSHTSPSPGQPEGTLQSNSWPGGPLRSASSSGVLGTAPALVSNVDPAELSQAPRSGRRKLVVGLSFAAAVAVSLVVFLRAPSTRNAVGSATISASSSSAAPLVTGPAVKAPPALGAPPSEPGAIAAPPVAPAVPGTAPSASARPEVVAVPSAELPSPRRHLPAGRRPWPETAPARPTSHPADPRTDYGF